MPLIKLLNETSNLIVLMDSYPPPPSASKAPSPSPSSLHPSCPSNPFLTSHDTSPHRWFPSSLVPLRHFFPRSHSLSVIPAYPSITQWPTWYPMPSRLHRHNLFPHISPPYSPCYKFVVCISPLPLIILPRCQFDVYPPLISKSHRQIFNSYLL